MSETKAPRTDTEQVRDLITRFEHAMNSRQLELLDDIMTDDFTRYCEATPDVNVRSLDDFKDFLRQNTLSFPDNVQRVEQVVVEGDRAGVWMTYEGTPEGQLGPFPPSGRRAFFHFGGIFTIRDGKLAAFSVTWDNVNILTQLGHLPAPTNADEAAGGR